ncbi:uncharacterized protein M6B38_319330 [Iris pallida]|uniref:Uncharacterized protein n=1 Tax=Iris pallida TaxID=29817 RepID=A0AAX6HE35_IRIPA|nr:uncharacterized protein M6B38_157370 [Iris pallida]KAJ6838841.1 uncharacterized protein M6B38_319330 [Iris pallida]
MAIEMDDDVFFADLSKQIALLIMDDDEEFPVQSPPLHLQGYHHLPEPIIPPPYTYEMAYRRESKGTGVFIPRSSLPKRKNRSGKSTSNNNSSQRHSNKSEAAAVSRVANNSRLHSNNHYASSGALKNRA